MERSTFDAEIKTEEAKRRYRFMQEQKMMQEAKLKKVKGDLPNPDPESTPSSYESMLRGVQTRVETPHEEEPERGFMAVAKSNANAILLGMVLAWTFLLH